MLYRKIENQIIEHLSNPSSKILIIDGARQIGKSFIIRHVGNRMFKNFVEINMELDKLGQRLFADVRTLDDFYLVLGAVAGNKLGSKQNTLVFIDEIQAYDQLLTMLKFLHDDGRYTYIASGSQLGISLRQTSSVPIGSIRIMHMYPLDFEEFIVANGVGSDTIGDMQLRFSRLEALPVPVHKRIADLFRKYLLVGGMPDAVNSFISNQNIVNVRQVQRDIHHLYGVDAARYEDSHRRLVIQNIFNLVPSNMGRTKKRVVVQQIEGKAGRRMTDYTDEFLYLVSAGVTLEVRAISNPSYPLAENMGKNLLKLYLNDVGILTGQLYRNNIKPILDTETSVNLGAVYESFVVQELHAHGFDLYYYDNKKNGEVDFLIDDVENMSVMPIEVKSGKDYRVHSALNHFLNVGEYGVRRAYVLSNDPAVTIRGGITYMPAYYAMFLSPYQALAAETH